MNYAIVCDTNIPDYAIVDFKRGIHGSWSIVPRPDDAGSTNSDTLEELLANPRAAAKACVYASDDWDDILYVCKNWATLYPELLI